MGGEGFEPSKAELTDLQSAPFGHSGIHPYKYLPCFFLIKLRKADERTRTVNLLITSQLLCQLSHIGICTESGSFRYHYLGSFIYEPSKLNITHNYRFISAT